MNYKRKNYCRCCLSKNLTQYLDLGIQSLANSYHKNKKQPKAPLRVNLCNDCFHSQLTVVVDPDVMFIDYLYVTGTTETFRKHTEELAKDAVSRFKEKKPFVLDVACNDGTQLEYFRKFGCDVMGVDPAKNLRKITKGKNIPVVVDYWTSKIAGKYKEKFDIITATNVFAHVDDVDEFLNASKISLKEDGLLILEFPYAKNMIDHFEFDTIYHEHLSYFLVNSFSSLAKRLDFSVVDIKTTKIHGGSIRFFLKKGIVKESIKVKKMIRDEQSSKLLKIETYKNFSKQVEKNKIDMINLINKLKKEDKKVIGYGASAKGNTMLNYFKIKFEYMVDDNELKQGYLTPGQNIPIFAPSVMSREKEDLYIVILAWNFYNEISKRITRLRSDHNDMAIVYLPKVEVRKIKNSFKQSA